VAKRALAVSFSTIDRDTLRERLILSNWDEVHCWTERAKKGVALESLCTLIFGTVPGWQRIESRVHSVTEEIDLVILNESEDVFWRNYQTLLLVECKNWSSRNKPGRVEFDAFSAKIDRRGQRDCRLGFFVSVGGVAETFMEEVRRIAKDEKVVAVIDEHHLWRLICADDRNRFLKELVVSFILGKR